MFGAWVWKRYGKMLLMGLLLILAVALAGCGSATDEKPVAETEAGQEPQTVTIYSGRNENLLGPILEQFQQETGIKVEVRYGNTAELAATILEEGKNSPADVYFAQDAGALGAIAEKGLFAQLPDDVLALVDPRFRSPKGEWVGISGRPRVIAYNTDRVQEEDLPDTILGFTDPEWKGRIGWAPTNGSFQAFVSAMIISLGEEATRHWLKGIVANNPRVYTGNTPLTEGIGKGEVDIGFSNHYYLYRFKQEQGPEFPVANHYLRSGDAGALMNVAGLGILETARNKNAAETLVTYLLSEAAQRYFAEETNEYPLVIGVAANPDLIPLEQLKTPNIDLSDLANLENTLKLLDEVGAL